MERVVAAPLPDAVCAHCGLGTAGGAVYCCYGCELAAELSAEAADGQTRLKATLGFALVLSMLVMMLSLFLFAEDVYGASADRGMERLRQLYRLASALLATPVIVLLGVPLGTRALRAGRPSMELLVGAGALAAFGLSIYHVALGRPGVYFDSATSALMLATLGRYLEASARARASGLLGPSLRAASEPVRSLGELIAPSLIRPGMSLEIDVDQVLPVDAEVSGAPAEVNLGVLTGESAPRTLQPGERVPAGAVPVATALLCVALSTARDSTLERLAELARSLRDGRSALTRLSDRFATALVPVAWLLALGSLWYWTAHASIERGVVVALAVVLAACPCTYGVIAPLVLWLALRRALEEGVLVRNAAALEELARVEHVAFDKTGTLTGADPRVSSAVLFAPDREVRRLVAALEEGTRHPVGRALAAWASAEPAWVGERRLVVGGGVTGRDHHGHPVTLGSMALTSVDARVALVRAGVPMATFDIGETLRPEARAAVERLQAAGIDAQMLTGDALERARAVGDQLGLPVRAGLSAEAKVSALGAGWAMVGDGLNDAPALAGVPGFAMEGGSGLSRGMAQVTLLRDDLRLVPWTLALARRAMSLARRSLAWSTAYNIVFVGLAAAGALKPVWAGLSMLLSSLLMLAGAMRVGAVEGVER